MGCHGYQRPHTDRRRGGKVGVEDREHKHLTEFFINPAQGAHEIRKGHAPPLPQWADDVVMAKALNWQVMPWEVQNMPAAWMNRIETIFEAEAAGQKAENERQKSQAKSGSNRRRR